MTHRVVAGVVGIFLMYTLHLGFRGRHPIPYIRPLSMLAATLFMAQVAVGAAMVWLDFSRLLVALHLSVATAVWGSVVALSVMSFGPYRVTDVGNGHA
jgi:heme A synthase